MCITADSGNNHLSCNFTLIKRIEARTPNESLAADAKGELCRAVGTRVCDMRSRRESYERRIETRRRFSGVGTYTEFPGSTEGFPLLLLSCLWTGPKVEWNKGWYFCHLKGRGSEGRGGLRGLPGNGCHQGHYILHKEGRKGECWGRGQLETEQWVLLAHVGG